ncbi:MAG: Crp/Fnr family transcriptional regulator, partial [Pyrinomonadaceae bacterium]
HNTKEAYPIGSSSDEYTIHLSIKDCWKEINIIAPALAYPAGVDLYRQGSAPQGVYLIESGLVKLSRLENDGQEIIDLRFPGWLLGAYSVLIQKVYPVTAVTLTNCHLRYIPAGIFEQEVKTNLQVSWYVHQMHSREVDSQFSRLTMLGCETAKHRLEQLLWLLSSLEMPTAQNGVRMQLPLKGREITRWIAVTPAYLCRLFEQLESEGIIRRHKGWLIIPNTQKIWHYSDV